MNTAGQKKSCQLNDSSPSLQRTKYLNQFASSPLTPRANALTRHCSYLLIATTISYIVLSRSSLRRTVPGTVSGTLSTGYSVVRPT